MTTNQENKYNMYLAIKEFFATWIAILETLPHFSEFRGVFLDEIAEIEKLSEQQMFNNRGKGLNAKRKVLKSALIKIASLNADKLFAYVLFLKDVVMQNELHYSLSVMKQSSDATVLKWAKGIYDRSDNLLDNIEDYGITADTQLEFKNAIDAFEASMPIQRISITDKNLITKQLVSHIDKADEALLQTDALVKILVSTQPDLCATYILRRKIINYGTRSMAVRGLIIDSITKIGLKGVIIYFLNADGTSLQTAIVKKSAAKGGFNIKTIPEGIYQIKLTKVGYHDLILTITIVNGELCKINAEMIKI